MKRLKKLPDRKYLAGDDLLTRDQYVAYLRRCADAWDRGVCCASPRPEQAAAIRTMANEVEQGIR